MELKKITENDLEFVRTLRNANRQWFFDDTFVTAESQLHWYKNYINNYIEFDIIWEGDRRVGTVAIKPYKDGLIEIGNIMIDAAFARRGIVTEAMKKLMNESLNYIAFVKHDNFKSANLFRKLGFKESVEDDTITFVKMNK